MPRYIVTLRGIAFQTVTVEADSASEARQKAGSSQWDDAFGYPDFERVWVGREAVEEDG